VYLCAKGPFGYAFSSHGYLGSRAVSARTSFPVWSAGATCRVPRVTVD
jgi:hypothetical protein